jgi:hypothetical protein
MTISSGPVVNRCAHRVPRTALDFAFRGGGCARLAAPSPDVALRAIGRDSPA